LIVLAHQCGKALELDFFNESDHRLRAQIGRHNKDISYIDAVIFVQKIVHPMLSKWNSIEIDLERMPDGGNNILSTAGILCFRVLFHGWQQASRVELTAELWICLTSSRMNCEIESGVNQ
jgi:hypothetical protein